MKRLLVIGVVLHMCVSCGFGGELNNVDIIRGILLRCRSPEGPSRDADLEAFARAEGMSDAEVAEILVACIQDGLGDTGNVLHRQLACSAIWALVRYGGEKESEFVRGIMRTTQDASLQRTTLLAGMRMEPLKWEEWVHEIATNNRFDSVTRFVAFEEAYRIGLNGDECTRQHVQQVLSEYIGREASPGNRGELQKWTSELKDAEKSAD